MSTDIARTTEIPYDLIEAIQSFPQERQVEHCGERFAVPALDIYAVCPKCRTQIKVRSFGAAAELEDVFDAVLEWMTDPIARKSAESRLKTIVDDQ
jgi:hypothetical protein